MRQDASCQLLKYTLLPLIFFLVSCCLLIFFWYNDLCFCGLFLISSIGISGCSLTASCLFLPQLVCFSTIMTTFQTLRCRLDCKDQASEVRMQIFDKKLWFESSSYVFENSLCTVCLFCSALHNFRLYPVCA